MAKFVVRGQIIIGEVLEYRTRSKGRIAALVKMENGHTLYLPLDGVTVQVA